MIAAFRHRLTIALAATALGITGLAGCGGSDEPETDPAAVASPVDPSAPEVTEDEVDPTPDPTPSTPTPRPTSPSGSAAASKFPPAIIPDQGQVHWSAFIAVGEDPGDPVLIQAGQAAQRIGYENAGPSDLGCSQGAVEGLKLDPQKLWYGVEIPFATRADAQRFERNFDGDIAGLAEVSSYCND